MSGISRQLRRILVTALSSALALGLTACGGSVVTNVSVGGTITGFTAGTLSLSNGLSAVTLNAGATNFAFPARVAVGLYYNVTVLTQPVGFTCSVANGSGYAISADITNVAITCGINNALGGTVSGLKTTGLTLANGSSTVKIPANSTSFVFPTKVVDGANYGVTILSQPNDPYDQICSVSNGSGTMGKTDVTSIAVTCN